MFSQNYMGIYISGNMYYTLFHIRTVLFFSQSRYAYKCSNLSHIQYASNKRICGQVHDLITAFDWNSSKVVRLRQA